MPDFQQSIDVIHTG